MKKLSKTIWTIAMGISLLALFSTCSGTLGGGSGIVRIAIPGVGNASSGRFVDSTTMTKGYVILGQGDQLYSVDDYPKTLINGGEVILSNIAEGTYILGVILQNDADIDTNKKNIVTGLALKEITVKPGYNEVEVTVGPGIKNLKILDKAKNNVIPSDLFNDTTGDSSVSFAEDTMIFTYGRDSNDAATVDYYPSFGEASNRKITKITASLIGSNELLSPNEFTPDRTGGDASATNVTVPAGANGVQFELSDGTVTYKYRLILE